MSNLLLRNRFGILPGVMLLAVFITHSVCAEVPVELKKLESTFHYQQGVINLLNGSMVINTGDKYRYLPPEDSRKVIEDGWGNPPGSGDNLGMLIPVGTSPFDDHGWGAELSYEDDSYISDDDAKTIDYNKILETMQQQNRLANIQRKERGYDAITLIGWAESPSYDPQSHVVYWAKRLGIEGGGESINYYIRNLGRNGVFNINVIADSTELPVIKKAAPDLLKVAEFTDGNRYQDHKFWDTTSEYGLGALVAGGSVVAAKKVGILGVVILFAKKFFVIILAAIAGLWKAFRGKSKKIDFGK